MQKSTHVWSDIQPKHAVWVLSLVTLLVTTPLSANTSECDQDSDADGLCDVWELAMLGDLGYGPEDDPDSDGMSNYDEYVWATNPLESDTDGDGLADGLELSGAGDQDPSSQTNPLAFDTDGDGLGDGVEDSNLNGMVDLLETDPTLIDSDGDSIDDLTEWGNPQAPPRDFDGDGVPDALDPDSDNDGVPDLEEAGDSAVWTKPMDNDGDGIPDFQDDDSDNDGIPDTTEALADSDLDGFPNPDVDGDGIPNVQDLDSDDDGAPDQDEGTGDTDSDGIPNFVDPIDDPIEPPDPGDLSAPKAPAEDEAPTTPVADEPDPNTPPPKVRPQPLAPPITIPPPDDNPDWDGDGLSNLAEEVLGTDPRSADTDSDSIRDDIEIGSEFAPFDTDGDGFLDALDLDSDGDAIPDRWEAGSGGTNPRDTDSDDIPDFRDLDSDSDGLLDREEVTVTMTDPYRIDTDGGSISDGEEVARGTDPNDASDDVVEPVTIPPFDPYEGAHIQGGVGACGIQPGTETPSIPYVALLLLWFCVISLRRDCTRPPAGKTVTIKHNLLLLSIVGALSAGVVPASAQQFDGRVLYLTADGTGVLGTPTAHTLGQFRYTAGISTEFLQDPLVVAKDGRLLQRIIGSRVDMTTHVAFGALNWLDFGLDLPATMYSTGTDLAQQSLATTMLGDLRIWSKAQAVTFEQHGIDVGVSLGLSLPTGSRSQLTGLGAMSFASDILLGGRIGPVSIYSSIGYRLLPTRTLLNMTSDDLITYSVAAQWDTGVENISLDAAVNGATSAFAPFSNTTQINLEGLVGLRWQAWRGLAVRGGVGGGMLAGPGTPVVRAYIGLSWVSPKSERTMPIEEPLVPEKQPEPEKAPPVDTDGDGIMDDVDKCPNEAEDKDLIDDEDGCPEHDRDDDGINDRHDKCPDEMEDEDGFEDQDGCPERDNDADGVPDIDDRCPDEKGVASDDDNKHGCPGRALVKLDKSQMRLKVIDESMVHFRWRTTRVPQKYRTMLKQVVAVLNAHPEIKQLRIEGHASWTGPAKLNKAISQRRAETVRQQLIDFGVDPARLEAVGYGFERLKVKRRGRKYNWLNRRVEFVIVSLQN